MAPPYESIKPEFLADERIVTAVDSADGSNEDDTKFCLGFLQ